MSNAIRELENIRYIEDEIQRISEQIERNESTLRRVTPVLSDMPNGGGSNDKIGDGVVRLLEWKEKLNDTIKKLIRQRIEILDSIEKIEDKKLSIILISFYLNREPLTKIAYEMDYEYYYLCSLKKIAIREFAKYHKKTQTQV